jgi:inosine-uridine nucleoside N-ribohydrolase
VKVVLDTDAGVDDAVAIALAANSPELELLAITTVAGNAPVGECTRNCLLLGELLWPAAPPPVAEGAASPLVRELTTAPEVHGEDGLGGELGTLPNPRRGPLGVPAHELLLELAASDPDEITLVATGPLTNVARALDADLRAVGAFREIVVMGGAFAVPGNTGPVAEFNFYVDPEAADAVMRSGLDLTIVPLDATTRLAVPRAALELLAGWAPALAAKPLTLPAVLARAIDYYIRYQLSESGLDAGYMHDPIAVASAFDPSLLVTRTMFVGIATEGDERGRSREGDPAGPPVRVATDVDGDAFSKLLTERVLSPVFGS